MSEHNPANPYAVLSLPSFLLEFDRRGAVRFVNPELAAAMGLRPEWLYAQNLLSLRQQGHFRLEHLHRGSLAVPESWSCTLVLRLPDGRQLRLNALVLPLRPVAGAQHRNFALMARVLPAAPAAPTVRRAKGRSGLQHLPPYLEADLLSLPRTDCSGDFVWIGTNGSAHMLVLGDASADCDAGYEDCRRAVRHLDRMLHFGSMASPAHTLLDLNRLYGQQPPAHTPALPQTMDATVLQFLGPGNLRYAAAKHSLYLRTAAGLHRLRGANRPLGTPELAVTEHQLQLAPGDTLYLCTDGYYSQLREGKPMRHDRFLDMLGSLDSQASPREQVQAAQAYFDAWRGPATRQTDDVTLLVLRAR